MHLWLSFGQESIERHFILLHIKFHYNFDQKSSSLFFVFFSIKMEVGIEDCLHIEFEYNKSKYVHGQLTLVLLNTPGVFCHLWQAKENVLLEGVMIL